MGYDIQVLTVVLTPEQCQTLSKLARKQHIARTIIMAKGTISNQFLRMLGVTSDRREVVNILLPKSEAQDFAELLNEKMELDKPGKGIAYLTDVVACIGAEDMEGKNLNEFEYIDPEEDMYKKITVVVDRGKSEEVMDAARGAGARGGTIFHGRGSAGKDAKKVFGIEIEPEKEIIVILTPDDVTKNVFDSISEKMNLKEPGNGIMYVEPISGTFGLFENSKK
jgi:nitrogen regulatory protein PII